MICKSCVVRILTEPVPNKAAPLSATATTLKLVNASFSGTSTVARPFASSTMFGFHSNSVSNNSRVGD